MANNTNEEKTIVNSELTASINYTPLMVGAVSAKLTTVDGYNVQLTNAKANSIGNRFNKVIRIEDTVTDPVTISYKNSSGVVSNVTSDQSILSFGGFDWNTIIDNNYSNLRDNVLNRYAKFTVVCNVPFYVINNYDFKEKVYIDVLGGSFVVASVSTLKGGLSEWELIKIN